MAPRIRTALLGTAMASGLLLNPLAAQALPLEEDSVTTSTTSTTPERSSSVETTQDAVPEGGQPQGTDHVAPAAGNGGAEALNDVAGTDPASAAPEHAASGSEFEVKESGPETADAPGAPAAPADGHQTPDESEPAELSTPHGDGAAESSGGIADGETRDAGSSAPVGVPGEPVLVPTLVEEPSETNPKPTQVEAEKVAMNEGGLVDLPWWLGGIEIPDGAEAWTDAQWEEFIEQIGTELEQNSAFQDLGSIVDDLVKHGRESDLDALYGHLLWMFDGNEALARDVFDEIMFGLIESGEVDAGIFDPREPDAPEVSATPEPTASAEKTKPEIKPAGSVVKPGLDHRPIVKAVVKPVVNSRNAALAETGSNGSMIYAGSGAALLLLGVAALRLRRKPKRA